MKKIVLILVVVLLTALLACQQQEQAFDLDKIDARQRLDDVLQDIDDEIETIKIDTMQLDDGALKESLIAGEQQLVEMRERVLKQLSMIDTLSRDNWQDFKTEIDSTEVKVTRAMQQVRESISTLTQRTPPAPPTY